MTVTAFPRLIRRVEAVLIDSVVFGVSIAVSLYLVSVLDLDRAWQIMAAICLPILALEPGLVTTTGGTIGHHLRRIRVRRVTSDRNLNFGLALLRFVLKSLLGWLSLVFVLITRRHQAVHDLLALSMVVHKDPALVPSHDALGERRIEEPGYVYPARWRRAVVIVLYVTCVTAVYSWLLDALALLLCASPRACGKTFKAAELVLSYVWLVSSGMIIVKGWLGELIGLRRRPSVPPAA